MRMYINKKKKMTTILTAWMGVNLVLKYNGTKMEYSE